jgi:hypothetical protein
MGRATSTCCWSLRPRGLPRRRQLLQGREALADVGHGVRRRLDFFVRNAEDLRFVRRVLWHDDQGGGTGALDVELDPAQLIDPHVQCDAAAALDKDASVGDGHQSVNGSGLGVQLLFRMIVV